MHEKRNLMIPNNAPLLGGAARLVPYACANAYHVTYNHDIFSDTGSTNYFYDALYRHHPTRIPVPDDYGLIAVRSELNEYPRTPGEQLCRNHFAASFSILLKFQAHNNMSFTLLNISDETGDKFSIAIDMINSEIVVAFSDCKIMRLEIPLGRDDQINVGEWHRIGIAVDPGFIALYKDCENTSIHTIESDCRVVCDESVEIGVLESEDSVRSNLSISPYATLHPYNFHYIRERWIFQNSSIFQTLMLKN